ncbi:MAG: helix-turn-helix domain-containing protein [Parvibaculaceae bacterium]|nr:helix-turn-helix domain-containing protein [Parvibaculaceae bacterium]
MEIVSATVLGRMIAAGRMLAGLDQAALADAAGVSASTISNVERGSDARENTIISIRKALRRTGVTMTIDKSNGIAIAAIRFDEPDEED